MANFSPFTDSKTFLSNLLDALWTLLFLYVCPLIHKTILDNSISILHMEKLNVKVRELAHGFWASDGTRIGTKARSLYTTCSYAHIHIKYSLCLCIYGTAYCLKFHFLPYLPMSSFYLWPSSKSLALCGFPWPQRATLSLMKLYSIDNIKPLQLWLYGMSHKAPLTQTLTHVIALTVRTVTFLS